VVLIVEDLTVIVVDHEHHELEEVALGPELRRYAAEAIADAAEVLRDTDDESGGQSRLAAADEAVRRFSEAVVARQRELGGDMFAAGAMAIALRQILAASPQRSTARPRIDPKASA
jgi:hypothetical protein